MSTTTLNQINSNETESVLPTRISYDQLINSTTYLSEVRQAGERLKSERQSEPSYANWTTAHWDNLAKGSPPRSYGLFTLLAWQEQGQKDRAAAGIVRELFSWEEEF